MGVFICRAMALMSEDNLQKPVLCCHVSPKGGTQASRLDGRYFYSLSHFSCPGFGEGGSCGGGGV